MSILKNNKKTLTLLSLSAALILNGCSSIDPYSGQNHTSDATVGTGIGAIGGAALGALTGGGRGALIGGAVGAIGGGLIGGSMDQENRELRHRLMGTGVQVMQHGNSIQLMMASDVTFKTNQSDVRDSFYPTLSSVATVLKRYDRNNIVITGFTDNTGDAAYNQSLSEKRAQSVASFLMSQGVAPNRLFAEGRGMRNAIASNATAAGRAMNRRVIVTLRPAQ